MTRRVDRLADKVLRASPVTGLFLTLAPGLLLVAASFMLGLHSIDVLWPLVERGDGECRFAGEITRRGGFLLAFNWSINFGLLFPLFVYFALEMLQAMKTAFERLRLRGMVVGSDFTPLDSDVMAREWRRRLVLLFRWGAPALLAVTLLFSVYEWWNQSFQRLHHGIKKSVAVADEDLPPSFVEEADRRCFELHPRDETAQEWCETLARAICSDNDLEVDWAVAAAIRKPPPPPNLGRTVNAAFTLVGYLWQAVSFALLFLFVGACVMWADVVSAFSRGRPAGDLGPEVAGGLDPGETVRLVPRIAAQDERRGFELFQAPLQTMVVASACLFAAFYFTRLQNVYLRTPLPAENVLEFVFRDLRHRWFAVGLDYSSWIALIVMILLLVTAVLVTFRTVGRSAARSRDALVDHLEAVGTEPGDVRPRRLREMTVWPHNFITQNVLLVGVAAALLCLVIYKLGVVYLAALAVVLVVRTVRRRAQPEEPERERRLRRDAPDALKAFISYAHEDEEHRQALQTHLTSLQRLGLVEAWHDRRIEAGQDWAGEIDDNLEAADLVLLLVSADFINSKYIWENELRRAMERHEARDARVIPIIVRSVAWAGLPFAALQALPPGTRAVASWDDADEAWTAVAEGIRQAAESMLGRGGGGAGGAS